MIGEKSLEDLRSKKDKMPLQTLHRKGPEMYERLNCSTDKAVAYRIDRKLSKEEAREIADELEGTIRAAGEPIRVLVDLQSFPYADLGALWEDLKFDVKHAKDLERFALVGSGKTEEWATKVFGLLTRTECRCFGAGQVDEAWEWLTGQPGQC